MTFVSSAPLLQTTGAEQETPRTAPANQAAFQGALKRAASDADSSIRRLVRPERTRLSGDQAAEALRRAWRSVVGAEPDGKTLSILTAQWAHETGRGQAMLNYNFGGIKGHGPSGLGAAYRTREGWGDGERSIVDTFRAYESAEQGATDYVALLARRYPEAVQAANNGDPRAFVSGLKQRGYFTGNEAAYTKSVVSLARQALANGFDALGSTPGPVESVPRDWDPFPEPATRSIARPRGLEFDEAALARVDSAVLFDEIARASLHVASRRRPDADEERTKV